MYNDLKPGDILQQKIDGFRLLPGMEHWVLFLGFIDEEKKQPLIVHLVNNDPATSLSSAWSLGSVAIPIGGSLISGGLSSNAPLVSSGGSSLVSSGSAALSPSATGISGGVLMTSGGIICGRALRPFISGLGGLRAAEVAAKVLALVFHGAIGVFLLAGGGMMLTSAASSYMYPGSSSDRKINFKKFHHFTLKKINLHYVSSIFIQWQSKSYPMGASRSYLATRSRISEA